LCGVCGGNSKSCAGCDGVANSGKVNDACCVCGGDGSSCAGCDGVPNSGKKKDKCGVCDGDGKSCEPPPPVPPPPVPVDCVVTKWSPWSQCSSQCGDGTMTKTRTITTTPVNGGKLCPETTDSKPCAPSPLPGIKVLNCQSNGDPHFLSFSNQRFNYQGISTYTLASTGDFYPGCDSLKVTVQSYQCPSPNAYLGVAVNVGLAVDMAGQKAVILGGKLVIDGEPVTGTKTLKDGFTAQVSHGVITLSHINGFNVVSTSHPSTYWSKLGYMMNFRVRIPEQLEKSTTGLCQAGHGINAVSPKESLFDSTSLAMLNGKCAIPDDYTPVTTAETACQKAGKDISQADAACAHLKADSDGLRNYYEECRFDWCGFGGDPTVAGILTNSAVKDKDWADSCAAKGQVHLCRIACGSSCRGYAPGFAVAGCLGESTCTHRPAWAKNSFCHC